MVLKFLTRASNGIGSAVLDGPMFLFIQSWRGHFGLSFAPQANSFDGALGSLSGFGAPALMALMRVATAPITMTEEMWSRFIGLSSVFVGRTCVGSYSNGFEQKSVRNPSGLFGSFPESRSGASRSK